LGDESAGKIVGAWGAGCPLDGGAVVKGEDPGMAVPSYGHVGRRAGLRYFGYINALLHRCRESNKKKVRNREGASAARPWLKGAGPSNRECDRFLAATRALRLCANQGTPMLVGDEDPD
jgi:hypothetical protein